MSAKFCSGLNADAFRRIPECALAAETEAIVTGDRAMLRTAEVRGSRIFSLSAYLGREMDDEEVRAALQA